MKFKVWYSVEQMSVQYYVMDFLYLLKCLLLPPPPPPPPQKKYDNYEFF